MTIVDGLNAIQSSTLSHAISKSNHLLIAVITGTLVRCEHGRQSHRFRLTQATLAGLPLKLYINTAWTWNAS